MTRTHPPTLLTLAKRALRDECCVTRADRILVAVSGGSDSMALLHVLARLAVDLGFGLVAHGVDHGLRPEGAGELDGAATLAADLGVPFERTKVSVRRGGNLQARAREARYAALDAARRAAAATVLATAHHADDRAETVLLRLLGGAGARGLGVLRPREGDRIRPLVRARKSDVMAHVTRHSIAWSADPSNDDRRHARVRVRLDLMPLLEELSPGIVATLTALADELGEAPGPAVLLSGPDGEIIELGRAHIAAIRTALRRRSGSARVRLPAGRDVVVDGRRGRVVVEPSVASVRKGGGKGQKRS